MEKDLTKGRAMSIMVLMTFTDLRALYREYGPEGLPDYYTAARWIRQGLVECEGGGRQHVAYEVSTKTLRELQTLHTLRQVLSFQALRRAAETLRTLGFNPFSTGQFAVIADGELVRIANTGEAIALLHQSGQYILMWLSGPDHEEPAE